MGSSVVQIEDTYARWLRRTDERIRDAFAAGDTRRLEVPKAQGATR